MRRSLALVLALVLAGLVYSDGPSDNLADKVRPVPPPGVTVPEADVAKLTDGIKSLENMLSELRDRHKKSPALLELLPDVEVFHKAVHDALVYKEFFNLKEIPVAYALLEEGRKRAEALRAGESPWTKATGLVVRGYRSRIDDSVQPYGLVVPPSYQPNTTYKFRLDGWFHGRGETLSELNFINGRTRSPGEFTPANTFVLHPYGRYCNANKFAGEIDFLEALEHAQRHYPIDENRIVVRGFSMGGAACWQFAVHYADRWCAAAPGAGFSETQLFLMEFQKEYLRPTWYEKQLWKMYDCTDYAKNLWQCSTVAYSGELDSQKQAADVMERAMRSSGISLVHIIGPKTKHAYHPESKKEISRRIDALAAVGRDPMPKLLRFVTYTLRYPRMHWITVEGMGKHWEPAHVDAYFENSTIVIYARDVTALTIAVPSGLFPTPSRLNFKIEIDDNVIPVSELPSDRSFKMHLRKDGKEWKQVPTHEDGKLRKKPGLQGPIDDAFMDRFLMVRPTGTSSQTKVNSWIAAEMQHAMDHWRRQFRGQARIRDDREVTDQDLAESNLILWGDPTSNHVLAKLVDKLPIQWNVDQVKAGDKSFAAADHVPVLIYPNPLNPKKYIVLNSGFTFREYDYLNNARQVPKLPDWAIFDIREPRTSRSPGKVVAAGFFGENWELSGRSDPK